MKLRLAAIALILAALAQAAPALVILVRHAERAGEMGDDPSLTSAGKQRADELARVVSAWKAPGGKVQALFASEAKRTQETMAPVSAATGVKVTVVPAKNTPELAKKILAIKGGIVVVAGHSNTVPEVIQALGGPAGITINDNEFDRLFALTGAGANATLVQMRYGGPTGPVVLPVGKL